MRVGIGYDIHRLKAGRKLILGGVLIPFAKGLMGHSDGDVLLHALTDAVLGALGAGDIGDHFSDKDPRWKGADSRMFAEMALSILKKRRFRIVNMDVVLLAEKPKLTLYKQKIRASVAKIFNVPSSSVSIKVKTNEGLDAVGKGQAMACYAVVSLRKG